MGGHAAVPSSGRVRRWAIVILGLGAGCGVLSVVARPVSNNIHVVATDTLYRSAQLSPERLAELIATNHIRSVLNLRGARPGAQWYDDEVATTTRLDVQHMDFELFSDVRISPVVADQLVRLMERLSKPLLIHCEGGSDRAGLASALYRYAIMGDAADEADRQLSFVFGHIPIFGGKTIAMDQSFADYVNSYPQPTHQQ